ncbi:MAG: hypothetical protein DCC68_26120 [Planctomycetota bacterium]|nr:MAG: hypothetical protein DCC68_26120 [Planctomycetota bacterium]
MVKPDSPQFAGQGNAGNSPRPSPQERRTFARFAARQTFSNRYGPSGAPQSAHPRQARPCARPRVPRFPEHPHAIGSTANSLQALHLFHSGYLKPLPQFVDI